MQRESFHAVLHITHPRLTFRVCAIWKGIIYILCYCELYFMKMTIEVLKLLFMLTFEWEEALLVSVLRRIRISITTCSSFPCRLLRKLSRRQKLKGFGKFDANWCWNPRTKMLLFGRQRINLNLTWKTKLRSKIRVWLRCNELRREKLNSQGRKP